MATQSFADAHAQFLSSRGQTASAAPPSSNSGISSFQQAHDQFLQQNTAPSQQKISTAPVKISQPVSSQQQQQPSNFVDGVYKGIVGKIGSILSPQIKQTIGKTAAAGVQAIKNLPEAHFADTINQYTPKGFAGHATAFAAGLAQGLINTPAEAFKGAVDFSQHNIKGNSTPQQQAADIASAVQLPLLFVGGGELGAIKQTGEQIARQTLMQGAKTVGKSIAREAAVGGGFGVLGGLQSGKDINNTSDYLKNLVTNIGIGAAVGGSISTITHGVHMVAAPLAKGLDAKLGAVFVKNATTKPTISEIHLDPKVAQATVLSHDLEKTPVGKAILKTSIEAQAQNAHVAITPKTDGEYTLPGGEKVSVNTVAIYNPKSESVHNFDKNIQDYRSFGGATAGTETENAALRDIEKASDHPEVKTHTQEQVQQAIKSGEVKTNEDGTVTLYRGGEPSEKNNLVSAAYDKDVAQQFAGEGNPVHEFKVKPEDIKAFIGKSEKEVLVQKDRVITEEKPNMHEGLRRIAHDNNYKFTYLRNTEKAPVPIGEDRFGQLIEPAGKYMNLVSEDSAKNFMNQEGIKNHETGTVAFKKPLIIDGSEGSKAWKQKLSEKYDGKTGKELTQALIKKGYDGIITMDGKHPSESIHFDKHLPQEEKTITKEFDKNGKETQPKGYKKVLTTNEVRAVRDVMDAKLQHIRETVTGTEEYGKELDKLVADITERSQGDKTILSALRTELNKEMFGLAGAGGNYKEAYATLQDIRKTDPEMGGLIDKFDDHIKKLDETLVSTPDKNYQVPAFVKERQKKQQGLLGNQEPVGTGKQKTSKAYEHTAERLLALDPERFKDFKDGQPFYNVAKANEQAEKASNFIEKNPQQAYRVAQGYENPPEGLRQNDVSVALSDRAVAEKNDAMVASLESTLTLRSTRYGQEIAALKGRGNENSPHAFIQQVLSQRLNRLGKSAITDMIDITKNAKGKTESVKKRAIARIDATTLRLQKELKKQQVKIQSAQSLLDALTCK